MRRADVVELHYIVHDENIRSVMQHGILCFSKAEQLGHVSWALDTAQERRARKHPADGKTVHDYANLYFDAHNPALSKLRHMNESLAVMRVSPAVLDIPGTMIASQNAASAGVRFYASPDGLAYLNRDVLYAEYWLHPDEDAKRTHGYVKCAEVLVPDHVAPSLIIGAYVATAARVEAVRRLAPTLAVVNKPLLFFAA